MLELPGLADPSLSTLIAVGAVIGLAGFIHGLFGLGFGMVATPLLALMTDVRSAIYISLVPTIALNVVSILRGGGWRETVALYWPISIWALFGLFIGTQMLLAVDPAPFLLLLSGIIVLYLNMDKVRQLDLEWIRRSPRLSMAVFGTAGGFTGGTVNAMVPPLAIWCLETGAAPIAMVQMFNFNFLIGKTVQFGVFFHAGTISVAGLLGSAPYAAVSLTALLTGMAIRSRFDEARYHGVLRGVLWAMAALLALRFAWEQVG